MKSETVVITDKRTNVRMIEVKGPGDKLSTKQILWIEFLNSVGIPTQVCHVLSQGSKFLSDPGVISDKSSSAKNGSQQEKEKKPRKERAPRKERKPRKRNVKDDDGSDFIE